VSAEPASAQRVWGTVDVNGLPVFYETEGTGDPIVLLHGGMADNSTWAAHTYGVEISECTPELHQNLVDRRFVLGLITC
jgi:pimeloyl-ACP methyl ester carboxylesterase